MSLEDLKKTWLAKISGASVFISATEKNNIDELRERLLNNVKTLHHQRYPNALI